MKRDVILADNFYENPKEVVSFAHCLTYVNAYPDLPNLKKSKYLPYSRCPIRKNSELIEKLEFLTGEKIDMEAWKSDFPFDSNGKPIPRKKGDNVTSFFWNAAFQVKLYAEKDNKIGDGIHNHTDVDSYNSTGPDGWVGLVYLDENETDLQGGLRTWRNKSPDHQNDWRTDKENWNLIDTFACVFNRIILFRGHIPHSASAGWGDNIKNARLFQTFFFKTLDVKKTAGVKLNLIAEPIIET